MGRGVQAAGRQEATRQRGYIFGESATPLGLPQWFDSRKWAPPCTDARKSAGGDRPDERICRNQKSFSGCKRPFGKEWEATPLKTPFCRLLEYPCDQHSPHSMAIKTVLPPYSFRPLFGNSSVVKGGRLAPPSMTGFAVARSSAATSSEIPSFHPPRLA
jgi:hypothetical protein